ncbi:DNA-binding transcriptional regulator, LysR family [Salegentibacter echinorum]|uniref:DNA-binding transcriptional regulator, LysR family n=1 Tax=Salegentibacter echinorum TaxID=1073325 RepID=A0A1M5E2V2_SALEC|nr:LysR family transcriptional regulator [Salegentibacter echinorum]SHF73549.1 DNA-binding transcriptional regulator, LysR family [Salegentibacter echinorum]
MDHKLRIFKEVVLTRSFTKAAENLYMSQPAVSKTIKNLEQEYGKAFFLREGNSIALTAEGKVFLKYANSLLEIFAKMKQEFSTENPNFPNHIKIGASTTIAQYVIPGMAASLQNIHSDLNFNLISGNTGDIQQLILNGQLDFGIIEGENQNTRLQYEPFVKDELVLVTSVKNQAVDESIIIAHLSRLNFVEREPGSGTREVIANALKKHHIPALNVKATLGSTESIKSYLRHSRHFAFLSIHAIKRELLDGHLKVIEVKGLSITRWFNFVSRQGFQSQLNQKLKNIFLEEYSK